MSHLLTRSRAVLSGALLLAALTVFTGCPEPISEDTTPPEQAVSVNGLIANGTDLSFELANSNSEEVQVGVTIAPAPPRGVMIEFDGEAVTFTDAVRIALTAASGATAATKQIRIIGLVNGTTYTLTVTTFDNSGNAQTERATKEIATPALAVPSGLALTIGDGEIALRWRAVTGATGYNVYRGGDTLLTATPIIALNYTDSGLTNGTDYSYTVRAVYSGGLESGDSIAESIAPAVLAPPTNLTPTVATGRVTLSWTAVTGAASYTVYRDDAEIATDISDITYIDDDVVAGMRYTYTVRAVSAIRVSVDSTTATATVPDPNAALDPPATLMFSVETGAVTLTWSEVTGAASYTVYRNTTVLASDITGTTHRDATVTAGESYAYTVRSVNSADVESIDSNEVNPTLPGGVTSGPPLNLMASAAPGMISLSWDEVAGTTYRVYRDGMRIATDLTAASHIDTNVEDGTRYSYTVRAANTSGDETADSLPATATAPALLPPPNNLAFTFTTVLGEVTLSWDEVAAADSYYVYRDGGRIASDTTISSTSYTDSDRTHGTQYNYTVRSVDSASREGAASAPVGVTPPVPLDPPNNFRGERQHQFFRFFWDVVAGAASYNLYRDGVFHRSSTVANVGPQFEGAAGSTQVFIIRTVDVYGREGGDSGEVRLTIPAGNDFLPATLRAAGNTDPRGIWSNGTTMWVADSGDNKLYAYSVESKGYTSARDFDLDAANDNPRDIWSDGTTMWVLDFNESTFAAAKIFAYNLTDGARVAAQDFNVLDTANFFPTGIWSDKTPAIALADATMWVADEGEQKVFAYNMASKARVAAKEFALHSTNDEPRAIWSNGTTMWVVERNPSKIFAYNLSDGARVTAQDFNTLAAAVNISPQGLWSNGELMWGSDISQDRIYAYNLESKEYTPE